MGKTTKPYCIKVRAEIELEVWLDAESEEAVRDYACDFSGDHLGLDDKVQEAISDGEYYGILSTDIVAIEEGTYEEAD